MYLNKLIMHFKNFFKLTFQKEQKMTLNDESLGAFQSGFFNKQTLKFEKRSKKDEISKEILEKFRNFQKSLDRLYCAIRECNERKYVELWPNTKEALEDLIIYLAILDSDHKIANHIAILKNAFQILKKSNTYFSSGNMLVEFFDIIDSDWREKNISEFSILRKLEVLLINICKH